MPRQIPNRTIGSERALAARIAEEREARDWTYDMLARRMEAAGCPLHPTALHKIEKARPPRAVRIDELAAFSNVFGISVDDLITPAPLRTDRQLRRLVDAWWDARRAFSEARSALLRAETHLRAHLTKHPDTAVALEEALQERATGDISDSDEAHGIAAQLSLLLSRSRLSLSKADQTTLDTLGSDD